MRSRSFGVILALLLVFAAVASACVPIKVTGYKSMSISNTKGAWIERICEYCGEPFRVKEYTLRPISPGRFGSRTCLGKWLGTNYGFKRKGGESSSNFCLSQRR